MQIRSLIAWIFFSAVIITGCNRDHFISERSIRLQAEKQYKQRLPLLNNRQDALLSILKDDLTSKEKEALQFLYAYSSLNDLADYDGAFFLENIRASFAARDTFHWGKQVPELLFRHFVLPVRINNENLDSSRWVFFNELKERIKSLPMKEAVLEINHWCHEKVIYKGTDGRTSSPLATVKTAYGRCGEESTFTTAALRAAGIPARQCYTPRWAHTDDNHAWVEVWVDGQWYFIGACEPDADLNMAWFTQPAKRAMLVNTTVFGRYQGPEEILVSDTLFTRINVLHNYTHVKTVFARVTDPAGTPVEDATVEFQLYNYAEFYPLFREKTTQEGIISFTTGYGDLMVRAAKDNRSAFGKLDVRTMDTIFLVLQDLPADPFAATFEMVPPIGEKIEIVVDSAVKVKLQTRLSMNDKIRSAYEATFIDSSKSHRVATQAGINGDTLWHFLHKSRGNWREIISFVTSVDPASRTLIFPLLQHISEKDLRDVNPEVLEDALAGFKQIQPTGIKEIDYPYLLNPRVDNEWLRPCREKLRQTFDPEFISSAIQDPEKVASWIRENISSSNENYSRAPITPAGLQEMKIADPHSIDIFFVALCRSFGIPSRLDPATKKPQYWRNNVWKEVILQGTAVTPPAKGTVILTSDLANPKKPEYSIHFSLGTLEKGFYKTLDFEGSPLVQSFPCTLEAPAGSALLITGNRNEAGNVNVHLTFFQVSSDQPVQETILLRQFNAKGDIPGKLYPEHLALFKGPGAVVAWINPNAEPTRHLLAELKEKKTALEGWKGEIVLVFPSETDQKEFSHSSPYSGHLPSNTRLTYTKAFSPEIHQIAWKTTLPHHLPVVIHINEGKEIDYLSEGYRIGIVDELLDKMGTGNR